MAKIFLSFTAADRAWAEWLGVTLRDNGHAPFLYTWEVGAGQNIPRWMERRIEEADHLIGVFSDAYAQGVYSNSERWSAYWQDPEGRDGFLVPVEVKPVTDWPVLVRPLRRLSLVGLNEDEAEKELLGFLEPPQPPQRRAPFPGGLGIQPANDDQHAPTDGGETAFVAQSEPLPRVRPSLPSEEGTGTVGAPDDKVPDPRDYTAFRDWLNSKPRQWSVVIAARAALRVLPLVYAPGLNDYEAIIILPLFRAAAISRLAAVCPHREIENTAAGAAAGAAHGAAINARHADDYAAYATAAANAARYAATVASARYAILHYATAIPAGVPTDDATARYAAVAITAAARYAAAADGAEADANTLTAVYDGRRYSGADIATLSLTRSHLWAPHLGRPDAIAKTWSDLKTSLLRSGDHWRVWTDWYDEILAGSPPSPERDEAWEAAFTDVDSPLPWEDGPEAVNLAIKARLEALQAPQEASLAPLPEQAPGPHYRANPDGRIDRAPATEMDAEGNDLGLIEQLRPLVLRAAADLRSRLPINQFPELITTVRHYEAALQPANARSVSWGEVWGLGVLLQNAAAAAERNISDRLLPEMEDPAKSALASLLRLHGPMILATATGARLTALSASFDMPPEQQAELRSNADEIVAQLEATPEVITPEALETIAPAVRHMGEGPRPERASLYGLVNIKNISIVLLAGAAVATPALLGMLLGGPAGAIVGAPFSFLAVETIKKNPTFLALVNQLNLPLEEILNQKGWERRVGTFVPFREFVIRNKTPLMKIAESTPELRWMGHYVKHITAGEDRADTDGSGRP